MSAHGVSRATRLATSEERAWNTSALTFSRGHARIAPDLLVGDVAELREHQGGALVLGQVRDVGQDRPQVLSRCHLGRQTVRGGQGDLGHRALAAGAQHPQAAVAGDGVEPRPQRGRRLGAPQVAVGGEERELHHVLGLLPRAEHVPAERKDGPVVAVEQRLERPLRAGAHLLDQSLIGRQPQQSGWQEVVATAPDGVGVHGIRSIPRAVAVA